MTAARAAADILHRASGHRPRVGIVLGSGLGGIADRIADAVAIPYTDIAGFPIPSVSGHAGRLVVGRLGGVEVACMQGRVHAYEGNGFDALKTAVRALKLAGCDTLVLTAAVGSLRLEVGPGRLMAISDHLLPLDAAISFIAEPAINRWWRARSTADSSSGQERAGSADAAREAPAAAIGANDRAARTDRRLMAFMPASCQ